MRDTLDPGAWTRLTLNATDAVIRPILYFFQHWFLLWRRVFFSIFTMSASFIWRLSCFPMFVNSSRDNVEYLLFFIQCSENMWESFSINVTEWWCDFPNNAVRIFYSSEKCFCEYFWRKLSLIDQNFFFLLRCRITKHSFRISKTNIGNLFRRIQYFLRALSPVRWYISDTRFSISIFLLVEFIAMK